MTLRQGGPAGVLEGVLAAVPPASGAVVMGTGIVSIALADDGRDTLSHVLLVVAAVVWVALGLLLTGGVLDDRGRVRREARSPAVLTGAASTAVLGTRFSLLGWHWAGTALLLLAVALWLVLLGPVLRHWSTPTVGVSLMLTVSTESLAVLAATLAQRDRAVWLLDAAFAPFLLGLAFYVFVVSRFDLRQLVVGRGDQWVSGGALAISTLAAGQITVAAGVLGALGGLHAALKDASLALWGLSVAWLPVLVAAELVRPRPGYDVRRWATVFPLGMYAACSFAVGAAADAPAIDDVGQVCSWVSLAVWVLVAAALARRVARLVVSRQPPAGGSPVDLRLVACARAGKDRAYECSGRSSTSCGPKPSRR